MIMTFNDQDKGKAVDCEDCKEITCNLEVNCILGPRLNVTRIVTLRDNCEKHGLSALK
jgi:hypothetical protein